MSMNLSKVPLGSISEYGIQVQCTMRISLTITQAIEKVKKI